MEAEKVEGSYASLHAIQGPGLCLSSLASWRLDVGQETSLNVVRT